MPTPRSYIAYSCGYKYQLEEPYMLTISIRPAQDIATSFVLLSMAGELTVRSGYAWDGPSGPTVDTPNFMRGSLVHDALYQLMRENHLDHHLHREAADKLLRDICIEDGMPHWQAQAVYMAVRGFAGVASEPSSNKQVQYAPALDVA